MIRFDSSNNAKLLSVSDKGVLTALWITVAKDDPLLRYLKVRTTLHTYVFFWSCSKLQLKLLDPQLFLQINNNNLSKQWKHGEGESKTENWEKEQEEPRVGIDQDSVVKGCWLKIEKERLMEVSYVDCLSHLESPFMFS